MRYASYVLALSLLAASSITTRASAQCNQDCQSLHPSGARPEELAILVQRARALVQVTCGGQPFELTVGFALGDRSTVVTTRPQSERCRRGASVRVEGHPPIRAESSVVSDNGFGILYLSAPLPESVVPLAVPPSGEPAQCDRVFSFGQAYGDELRGAPSPEAPYPYAIRGVREDALGGSPLLGSEGQLLGMLLHSGTDSPRVRVDDIVALLEDPEAEHTSTRSNVTWSYQVDLLNLLIQPDVGVGLGFEAGVEAAYRDEWTLSASAGGYVLGLDTDAESDGFAGFRLSTEVRVGYRFALPELEALPLVLHLSAGVAVGYEERPELEIGSDGVNFFTTPTVRLSVRYFMFAMTYAAYFDVDHPENTAHMINLGYALEF